jgi:hypothetical protein
MHTSKPPPGTLVDWAHPLAQGLIGAWLFNEGAGVLVNDATGMGHNGVVTTPDAATQWQGGPLGTEFYVGGTSGHVLVPAHADLNLVGDFTIAFSVTRESGTGYPGVATRGRDSQWSVHFQDQVHKFRFQGQLGGATFTVDTVGYSNTGAWVGVITRIGAAFTWYLQGTNNGITTGSNAGAIGIATNTLAMGTELVSLAGSLRWLYISNQGLQPEAVASLMGNPWQMMWDRKRYWYAPAAAEGYVFRRWNPFITPGTNPGFMLFPGGL